MATVAIGDLLRVAYVCKLGAQRGVNVRYYRVTGYVGGPTTDVDVARGISAYVAAGYKGILSNQASYEGLELQDRTVTPTPDVVTVATGIGVGGFGTTPLPGNVAAVVTVYTGIAGRANRGRVFLPFPPVEACEGGTSTPSPTPGYNIAAEVVAAFHVGSHAVPCPISGATISIKAVLQHTGGGLEGDLTHFLIRDKWGTIHSRGSYGAVE